MLELMTEILADSTINNSDPIRPSVTSSCVMLLSQHSHKEQDRFRGSTNDQGSTGGTKVTWGSTGEHWGKHWGNTQERACYCCLY